MFCSSECADAAAVYDSNRKKLTTSAIVGNSVANPTLLLWEMEQSVNSRSHRARERHAGSDKVLLSSCTERDAQRILQVALTEPADVSSRRRASALVSKSRCSSGQHWQAGRAPRIRAANR